MLEALGHNLAQIGGLLSTQVVELGQTACEILESLDGAATAEGLVRTEKSTKFDRENI